MVTSVIRVPRTDNPDEEGSFVLINVEHIGSRSLDLNLVGTEGENPYYLSLKQSHVRSLRAKNAQCGDEEWEKILKVIFLLESSDTVDEVEAVASIEDGKSITLMVRKNVEGITSRLGSLILKYDESQEISLFDWTSLSCLSAAAARKDIIMLQEKCKSQEEAIAALQAQFNTLTTTKESHETELLQKFQILLNEKKAKIRDQQRLLAASNVDPDAVARMNEGRHRNPGSSRHRKRKADEASGSDDGFEKMDVDSAAKSDVQTGVKESSQAGSGDEGMNTPSEDEEETADEDEPPLPANALTKSTSVSTRSTKQVNPGRSKDDKKAAEKSIVDETPTTPPKRNLPFQQKTKQKAVEPDPIPADDEETASEDDDEL